MLRVDVAVVGGGIVGLAAAWALARRLPRARIALLEKEAAVAQHQSGRNSGVLHSGVHCAPGSRKARTCLAGRAALQRFCAEQGLPLRLCGKVVVALEAAELPRLAALEERGRALGVACERIDARRLLALEPHARGLAALHVPGAGVVDFAGVCARLAELLVARGVALLLGTEVRAVAAREGVVRLGTAAGEVEARLAVACAGLHADRLARLAGARTRLRVLPFRGEFYELAPRAAPLCRALIYPLPRPGFPFLGVHLTRGVDGRVRCGPNAVLAFAREGYERGRVDAADLLGALAHGGLPRLVARHWRIGMEELHRSLDRGAFARTARALVPELREEDLLPAPAGVRAQAVGPDGALVDDFVVASSPGFVHLLNAPSPAATAAFAIGEELAVQAAARLG